MPTTKFFISQITSQKKECEKKRELFPPPRNISLFGLLIWEKTVSPTAFFKKRQEEMQDNSSQRERRGRRDFSRFIPYIFLPPALGKPRRHSFLPLRGNWKSPGGIPATKNKKKITGAFFPLHFFRGGQTQHEEWGRNSSSKTKTTWARFF